MRLLLALVPLLAGACVGEEEPPALDGELEIGSASSDGVGFEPIADGETAILVPGAQGGFHVWTGVRVRGAMGELYLDREARRVSDGLLVSRTLDQYLEVPEAAMEDWWVRESAPATFMCPAPLGVTIFDTELEFTARLYDADGALIAEDQMVLTPVCPTGEQEATCFQLCDG